MKFRQLESIAHNIADSLGSGVGILVGAYEMDIFGESTRTPEGFIEIDFLTGKAVGGKVSRSLAREVSLYRLGLVRLCNKHMVSRWAFSELSARYSVDRFERHTVVSVRDHLGRRSVKEYVGCPGRRIRILDRLGRVRPH
jgi:hypothetical protein